MATQLREYKKCPECGWIIQRDAAGMVLSVSLSLEEETALRLAGRISFEPCYNCQAKIARRIAYDHLHEVSSTERKERS